MDAAIARPVTGVRATPFIATSFLGAALIFLVQPMFAKMATPLLGGAPAVWNVSLVCFQAALLAGYAYAHALSRVQSVRTQIIVHAVVLTVGFLCLPLGISGLMGEPDANNPTLWLIGTFAVSILPPFAAISATAPLVQHWYARSGLPDAGDPYHLYAASNIGSMTGLIMYPVLVEPFAPLAAQADVWTVGYVVLALGLLYAGWTVSRNVLATSGQGASLSGTRPDWRTIVLWLALSFVPSSLLVGVTTHITTDVAAAPFLWAPPLILYLLTFVISFGKSSEKWVGYATRFASLSAALVALGILKLFPGGLLGAMGADLVALFVLSLACHGKLNAMRPDSAYLTQFYLIMSLGGVLGGAFNALLAPVIFDGVYEYPLAVIAALALLAMGTQSPTRPARILLGASVVCLLAVMLARAVGYPLPAAIALMVTVIPLVTAAVSSRAPLVAAGALACVVPIGLSLSSTAAQWSERSFFGVLKVSETMEPGVRTLLHGTTIHGSQALEGDVLRPRTYYAPETPIGQAFGLFPDAQAVAVVGLGAGASACHAQADQAWTFYEIDPLVVQVAQDPEQFTFMSSCQPDAPVVIGDARVKLEAVADGAFDFMLLDAFSSDSVPTHLLTREAMELYLDKLGKDGVLVFHISNRHLDLAPVVAGITRAAGAQAVHQIYRPDDAARERGASASEVAVVSRNPDVLDRVRATGLWSDLESNGARAWTDDYSNIIGAMLSRMMSDKDAH